MFDSLPLSALDALDWTGEQYQPYFDHLLARKLDVNSITDWLADWSKLGRLAQEVASRINVATTVDTTDPAAEARHKTFYTSVHPVLLRNNNGMNQKLVDSGLAEKGLLPHGFEIPYRNIKVDLELFREENIPLLNQERQLELEHDKLKGAQTVQWEGRELTVDQIQPLLQDNDRDIRERAWKLSIERQLQDRQGLNNLWEQMHKVRRQIAANAGLSDYRAYCWKAMKRFDYTPENCEQFHAAIEQVVVPAASRLHQRRREQLGLDVLRPWDLDVDAQQRPALRPYHSDDELESRMEAIFNQVDPALGGYFHTMRAENLLDLPNRKGKAPGGYCTEYPLAQRPFIFMNTVGLHGDVQTLLHEGGHAFHVFETNTLPYLHQQEVPTEFAEVASMSMELIGAPYLDAQYGGYYSPQNAARAQIEHLEQSLAFWPYMAVVDAFQHWVYTHPDASQDADNCDAQWSALWDRFMPDVSYEGLEAAKVTGWHRKLHIFVAPMYYIEYGLAQLGAVQVWGNSLKDQKQAVIDYRKALSQGGTLSLPDLFAAAGARFAFDANTLQQAVDLMEGRIAMLETSAQAAGD